MVRRLLLTLLLIASPALGAPSDADLAKAKEHFETAQKFYNVGEFAKAIDEYKIAFEITDAPGLLFNIAQAYRLSGNYDQALFFYNSYLRAAPDASNRADVEKLIEELQAVKREHPPEPPTEPSASQPVTTPPASQPSRSQPPPPPPPIVPATHERNPGMAKIGRYTLIGGAVGFAVGVLFGVRAMADASTITSEAAAHDHVWTKSDLDTYNRGRAEDGVAVALYTVGSLAAITGAVLWYAGGKKVSDEKPTAAVGIVPGGATMVFTCGF